MEENFFTLSAMLAFQAPVLCIIFCAYIFISVGRDSDVRRKNIPLRLMCVFAALLMIFEVADGVIMYDLLDIGKEWAILCTTLAYACSLMFLVTFSELCIAGDEHSHKALKGVLRLMYVVVGVVIIARLLLVKTGLFTGVGADGELRYGALDDLQTWGCVMISVLLDVLLIVRVRDKADLPNREKNVKLLLASLLMTFVHLMYVLFYIPYIVWMGSLVVLFMTYSSLQSMMIFNDELTSLGNRRLMIRTASARQAEQAPWAFIMTDVNSFKEINDTYGHAEGNRALKLVADVLRETSARSGASAFRMGGDEFAVIVPGEEEKALWLCAEIAGALSERAAREKLPYALTISCGCSVCGRGDGRLLPDVIQQADDAMYENKHAYYERTRVSR